jgi:hypothetical protein
VPVSQNRKLHAHAQETVNVLLEVNHVPVSLNRKLLTHAIVGMPVNVLLLAKNANADQNKNQKFTSFNV